jgi:hypothetical protein
VAIGTLARPVATKPLTYCVCRRFMTTKTHNRKMVPITFEISNPFKPKKIRKHQSLETKIIEETIKDEGPNQ